LAERAWAIKLGSGGRCVPFCEEHAIVGVGWKNVDPVVVIGGTREEIYENLAARREYKDNESSFGQWTGSLCRFGQTCTEGDYVLYYDPGQKRVQICRVLSALRYRDFDLEAKDTTGNEVDIGHYRTIEFATQPIPILDLYGAIKGKLLGPRGTFWELRDEFSTIDQLAKGLLPHVLIASDPEIRETLTRLRSLVVSRAEALNERDWEFLVADYFKAQGAQVDESAIGGSRGTIDVEAIFTHGEIPASVWRVQVKRLQNREVDWASIESDCQYVGEAQFCYVSVFGFTGEARLLAEEKGVLLLQAEDFTSFLLSGKVRESVARKLLLPRLEGGAPSSKPVRS
jgi:predicted Mrr-cat superfamily restriction endonuclease